MKRIVAALLAVSALSGCNLEPRFTRPQPLAPSGWPAGDPYLRQSEAALPSISYRDIFKDPNLQAIIAQALANNQDLRVALANVASARAQYHVQRADLFPQIDASAGLTDRHTPRNGATAGISGGGPSGVSGDRTSTTYQIQGGTTAWEIDLFGRLRSLNH
jgi:multidrug efflux system outer membrane protein